MAISSDPCRKIWSVLPQDLAQYDRWRQYPDTTPYVLFEFYYHHVVVLDWAGMPGFVKIAMIVASIPPTRYWNPKDHFTIHGTSDGKPSRNDNKVKLRRNPQFEGMVINCYVRMDWICVVPVSIIFWWMEMEHQLPRHQLMLQLESMEKLLANLKMKEPLPSIAENSEGAEQAGETDAIRHELARYRLKELNEDTEPADYDQYFGYALGTHDTTCAYSTLVFPRFELFSGSGCTVLDPASSYCRAIRDQYAQLKLDVAIFHNLTQQSAHSSGTTGVEPILALINH